MLAWVVFSLDKSRYALPLAATERVLRAAEVTPLPAAPPLVLGALNVAGEILPVITLRRRFGLPERPIRPDDHFLIARSGERTVVLVIDAALGVIERPAVAMVAAARISDELAQIRGVLPLAEGLVLIQDLEQLLSAQESQALNEALRRERAHAC